MSKQISAAQLDQTIHGVNLAPAGEPGQPQEHATLRDVIAPQGTVFIFLRHFGCTFCRMMVSEVRAAVAADPNYPPVVFVFAASVDDGREFFARFWPAARAIADESRALYALFGVEKGTLSQLLGPKALACGIGGLLKGHGIALPKTDPTQMPGVYYVRGDKILWSHDFSHAGDHPDFTRLPSALHNLSTT